MSGCEQVSIHAPTRGATIGSIDYIYCAGRVSIHAPTRGATSVKSIVCRLNKVSIHAPTRGATAYDLH